jgi:hypothetical protein
MAFSLSVDGQLTQLSYTISRACQSAKGRNKAVDVVLVVVDVRTDAHASDAGGDACLKFTARHACRTTLLVEVAALGSHS